MEMIPLRNVEEISTTSPPGDVCAWPESEPMTRLLAMHIVGKFSTPQKMSNPSWGLPAEHCVTGSIQRKIKGTVCAECYALKGRFVMNPVKGAYQRRYDALNHPRWTEAMIWLVGHSIPVADPFMRLLDSGDVPNIQVLRRLVTVAVEVPNVTFWLPTTEHDMIQLYIKRYGPLPENLVVRYSAIMLEEEPGIYPGSGVTSDPDKVTCHAKQTDNKCLDCHKCWDPKVKMVWYPKH
jgi:hypothetical protein